MSSFKYKVSGAVSYAAKGAATTLEDKLEGTFTRSYDSVNRAHLSVESMLRQHYKDLLLDWDFIVTKV